MKEKLIIQKLKEILNTSYTLSVDDRGAIGEIILILKK